MRYPTAFSFLAACLAVGATAHAGDTVHVAGPGITVQDYSVQQLKDKFATSIRSVDFETHGKKHTGLGVPMLAVLKASGLDVTLKMDPHADPNTKNLPLRMTILVRGSDGYTSAFSVAELLPDIGNHAAWLMVEEDGSPLPARSAPIELVSPDDAKPGRWVRGVAEITVTAPTPAKPAK